MLLPTEFCIYNVRMDAPQMDGGVDTNEHGRLKMESALFVLDVGICLLIVLDLPFLCGFFSTYFCVSLPLPLPSKLPRSTRAGEDSVTPSR
jgi:hypothetical protein